MFRPPSGDLADQWFELYNAGAKAVTLAGWKITRGVDFTFPANAAIPPNGYFVVAAESSRFHAAHPEVENYTGGWRGQFRHHLELADANGKVVNAVEFYSQGDWAERRMGPVMLNRQGWEWYQPADGLGSSLELVNPALPNSFAQNWLSSTTAGGTPGAANDVLRANTAPFISGVAHWPPIPASTNAVVITARITDEALAGTTAALHWRVDGQSSFNSVPMADDGAHEDDQPQDGVFGASIPAHSDRTIIEFFVTAADAAGNSRVYPNVVPSADSPRTANLLFQFEDGVQSTTAPVYRIIMTEAERAYLADLRKGCPDSDSDAQMNGTWVTRDGVLSGGSSIQLRYNIGVRNRGHGTRTSIPHNYHVNVPEDRLWKGEAGINLNSHYAFSQVLGSAVMRKSGIPMPDSRLVKLRVNGVDAMAGPNDSFGMYAANEQYNQDFIQRAFPLDPEGNAYRGIRDQALCVPAINGVADLKWHGADWPVAAYTNAYFKQNNFASADYTDLLHLISVLNLQEGTTEESYVRDMRSVLDVAQWMRYMAANTLLDNNETALANGVGDDYALYRGVLDPRFLALPYDLDSVMGRGESSVTPRDGIFRMNALPAIERLMKTPEFAPLYFQALQELASTVFASSRMNPLLDHLLGDYVSAGALENMKAFNASHVDYVLAQIPSSLSVTSSLPVVSGFWRSTQSSAQLSGNGNAIRTRQILVNGQAADWVAWQGVWSSDVPLHPGINRLRVQALDENAREFESQEVDVWYDDGSVESVAGSIASDTVWRAGDGPFLVQNDLTIPSGATLTIEPGTSVYFGANASLTVADGGRLLAEGTMEAPIRFTREPGATGSWGGIAVRGSVGSPETRITHARIEYNGSTAIHSSGGTVFLDYLTFGSTDHQYVSLDASSFVVSHCYFPQPSAAFEPTHGTGGIKAGGHGILSRNFFGPPIGYSDVFDFTGGQRGTGAILYFVDNVVSGSGDDALDLDGTDAWVEHNIFMHIHQNGAPDSSSAVSGGDDGNETSEVTVIGNIIFDCDNAGTAKQGDFFTFLNNTIVHMTTEGGNDFAASAVNVRDTTPSLTTFGKGYYMEGNIIADVPQLVRNNDPSQAPVTFNNNILPVAWDGAGANNYIGDPLLKHVPTVAEANFTNWAQAQVMWEWFSPQAASPARGAGPGGNDLGGVVPSGVYLAGAPQGTNAETSVTVAVGINRRTDGVVPPGWPDGAGFTAYKWRLDNGDWSNETPITNPIVVSGLGDGPHEIQVVGKSDSGLYQNDPLLGDSATITSTGVWYVDSTLPVVSPGKVRINEILAKSPASSAGAAPDWVELYNAGTTPADLSGCRLANAATGGNSFFFPASTMLAAGEYLVLSGGSDVAVPGLHLGFSLDGEGDALFFFSADGRLIDAVQFGRQILGSSLGRFGPQEWSLAVPSFGTANQARALGSVDALRINEWLADREFSVPHSFIELYNSEDKPVDLSGLFLSDTAGTPNRSSSLLN